MRLTFSLDLGAAASGQMRIGNVDSILAHSKTGAILYSSRIPSTGDGAKVVSPEAAIATDVSAFQATANRPYCGLNHYYPTTTMRWSSFGLKHSITPFLWTSEGLGTYFQLLSGRQVLYIANPRSEGHLGEICCFLSSRYNQDIPDPGDWYIEEQVLEPGSTW